MSQCQTEDGNLEGRLHNLESPTVHLNNEENESVHVLASSSLKLRQDTKRVLNCTEDIFRRLQSNLNHLQPTMESLQRAQVCDHRRTDIFMFAFRAQSAINNVTWTLNAIQSELQIETLYMTEKRKQFATGMGVSRLKLSGKKLSIP